MKTTKYIFITGGVVSGLGKGITGSSLGALLKNSGLKVYMQKFDPYLNVDPGTMSPYQHGEVYVTNDGGETDLDLGHYERFIDENLSKISSTSAGRIYLDLIESERKGYELGQTIQVVPHVINRIKQKIYEASEISGADVVITEIGGTVGDIESQPFIESIRQVRMEQGKENTLFLHVALLLYLTMSKEYKTKPIQSSVKELLSNGIQPDILVTRSDKFVSYEITKKISMFCNVPTSNVIQAIDAESIYEIPLMMMEQDLHKIIIKQLKLDAKPTDMTSWINFNNKIKTINNVIKIGFVGKYIELQDAYLSVVESFKIAGYELGTKVELKWIQADQISEQNHNEIFSDVQGIMVPGGFGDRGIEGMLIASRYARTKKIPYFGICLGMQIATIEVARNMLNLTDAHSTEFNPDTENPIFDFIHGIDQVNLGGTLRLGLQPAKLVKGSKAYKLYGSDIIWERHRHRYEFNNNYKEMFESKTPLKFTGYHEEKKLMEVIELTDHPFFMGVQYHPEFMSRPNKPSPIFKGFIQASLDYKNNLKNG